RASAGRAAERDFKSRLQEISQARLHMAPTYSVIAQQGPDHDKTFEVAILLGGKEYGRAQGKTKKGGTRGPGEPGRRGGGGLRPLLSSVPDARARPQSDPRRRHRGVPPPSGGRP